MANKFKSICCIYKITNNVTGKIYIGSAVNFRKRKNAHLSALQNNRHENRYLQRAYNSSKESFVFEIIEELHTTIKEDIIKKEQYYLDRFKPDYNIKKLADSSLGVKRSLNTRLKMSQASKGKPKSLQHRLKLTKPIVQFSLDYKQLQTYISATEAAKILQLNRRSINNCLKGRAFTSGNYIWKYETEVQIGK